jgi:hypothetical protein
VAAVEECERLSTALHGDDSDAADLCRADQARFLAYIPDPSPADAARALDLAGGALAALDRRHADDPTAAVLAAPLRVYGATLGRLGRLDEAVEALRRHRAVLAAHPGAEPRAADRVAALESLAEALTNRGGAADCEEARAAARAALVVVLEEEMRTGVKDEAVVARLRAALGAAGRREALPLRARYARPRLRACDNGRCRRTESRPWQYHRLRGARGEVRRPLPLMPTPAPTRTPTPTPTPMRTNTPDWSLRPPPVPRCAHNRPRFTVISRQPPCPGSNSSGAE